MAKEKALDNPLVLRQIFIHMPKSLLLSPCSLVNKIWRKEALTCFRDRRKVRAVKTESMTDCKFIQQLDETCWKMAQEGHSIPWNALKLIFDPVTCSKDHSTDEKIELRSPLKVKHLDIFWDASINEPDCPIHQPLKELIFRNSDQLISLKFTNVPLTFLNRVLGDGFSGFPKLEKITISTYPEPIDYGFRTRLDQEQVDAVRNLLKTAPALKRICVNDLHSLKMVPEEKYKMLEALELRLRSLHGENLFQIVAEKRPNLRKLRINQSDLDICLVFPRHPANRIEHAFNRSLQQVLASCHQTLEKLQVTSPYSLLQLSFPPLVSLRELKLVHKFGGTGVFFKNLIFLGYDRQMPNLKTLEVNMAACWLDKKANKVQ